MIMSERICAVPSIDILDIDVDSIAASIALLIKAAQGEKSDKPTPHSIDVSKPHEITALL
ncbi:hypothetical protein GCM10009332_26940 [Shewanella gelidii]|uniref:Uncharacterized protein n=2 Tax=Shewanella gelidii TaxID=1642821 RepID=A0A917JW96_9GAMM|nr:hypothetical protein GCM10009332_26940 [Shewanella gelidii]